MLQEMQRFSADESGQGSDLIVGIVVAVILVILAVTIFGNVIRPALAAAADKIKGCIDCAMDPACSSC